MNMNKKYNKIIVTYDISYTYNKIICGVFRVIKKYIHIVLYSLFIFYIINVIYNITKSESIYLLDKVIINVILFMCIIIVITIANKNTIKRLIDIHNKKIQEKQETNTNLLYQEELRHIHSVFRNRRQNYINNENSIIHTRINNTHSQIQNQLSNQTKINYFKKFSNIFCKLYKKK